MNVSPNLFDSASITNSDFFSQSIDFEFSASVVFSDKFQYSNEIIQSSGFSNGLPLPALNSHPFQDSNFHSRTELISS
jgi:hypothetical protein